MKRTVSSLTLVALLTTIVSPVHAGSWRNGFKQVTQSGSLVVALAGAAAAAAGIQYFVKNGLKSTESQICADLSLLEYESSRAGHIEPRRESVIQRTNVAQDPFGQDQGIVRTTSVEVTDPAVEAHNAVVRMRECISRLSTNLTQQQFDRLTAAKTAYDQVVAQQPQNSVAQGIALNELQRIIQELKNHYPADEGYSLLAGLGIGFGALGIMCGIVDFGFGANRR